jgi:hypothetical protein
MTCRYFEELPAVLCSSILFVSMIWSGTLLADPKFPPPPDSTIGKLGESMIVNGIAMDIRQFVSNRSVEQVLEFYRQYWPAGTEEKPGYTETDILEPWNIITRVEDGYLMTVQVTSSNGRGSSGLLGMSRLPDPEKLPELGKGFPKMRGSHVLNDVMTEDIGKHGRTLQMTNQASVENNTNFYRNHYVNQGWGIDLDQAISGGDTHSLRFSQGKKNVNIVIHRSENGVVIVAQTEN